MKNKMLKVISKPTDQEYWTKIIRESQASNLSNKEFCAQRGIAVSAFYYWKRRLPKFGENGKLPFFEIPGIFQKAHLNSGNHNDVISISVSQDFRFNISFDMKTILPIIQEVFGKRK